MQLQPSWRPQDGQVAALALELKRVLCEPRPHHQPRRARRQGHQEFDVRIDCNLFLRGSSARVRVRLEIQLPTAPIGYVGVELRRREIGMSEHFLNGSQVCSSLEQVGSERVPQQVGVDAVGVEPGLLGQLAQDQEGAGARQRAARGRSGRAPGGAGCRGTGGRVRGSRRSASAAWRPIGTTRSLPPLPITRTSRSSRSTPALSSPIASETRRPAP